MSAVECLQLLSSRMPDLLILDVEMPDIDGFQLCKKLKAYEKTADIPVIFLSASGSESAQEQMKEVGGEAFVRKPFLPAALISAVENALH